MELQNLESMKKSQRTRDATRNVLGRPCRLFHAYAKDPDGKLRVTKFIFSQMHEAITIFNELLQEICLSIKYSHFLRIIVQ